jgi:putative membrane protein
MWQPQTFGMAVLAACAFGIVGIVLMMIGFKAFDIITPKIDIQKELAEHHNLAVAIVIASVVLGIAVLLHAVLAA